MPRRRLLIFVALTVAAVAGGAAAKGFLAPSGDPDPSPERPAVKITASGREVLRIELSPGRAADEGVLRRRLERAVPAYSLVSRGRARVTYRFDLDETVRRARALGPSGGVVEIPRQPIASRIRATVLRQRLANTCESAALQILLSADGRDVSQQRLQEALPRSGPLDPAGTGSRRVWGDPDLGYVGRPDGGGLAGGFGVYPAPVARVAARFGHALDDLTGSQPARVYGRVLRGRAVMVWIGLSDGPYGRWTSPSGRAIKVNFGEHTVVLTGVMRDGSLRVVNPLQGTSEVWSRARFETAWSLLGRRALGLP